MKTNKMSPVVHFEMPAEDRRRMANFYETVFGWRTEQLGKDMEEYVVVTTTETDENRMIKNPGAINGGFYQKPEDPLVHHPSIVIAVDDLEKSMRDVEAAGGKLHGKPYDIKGIGRYMSIIDTEGNRVGLLQPLPREK